MSGLVLSLKADEKFLVNGALVQNGSKRGQIRLPDNCVSILRLSDCLHPSEISTPVQRTYYQVQLILSGDKTQDEGAFDLLANLLSLEKVFTGTKLENDISKAIVSAGQGRFYSVLVILKRILPIEAQMLMRLTENLSLKQTG